MPPVQPSERLRSKVNRREQGASLSKVARKATLRAEIERSKQISEKAVRLYTGIKRAGLLEAWFPDPTTNPDYPNQEVSYGLDKTGTTLYERGRYKTGKKRGTIKHIRTPEVTLYARVSASLPDGEVVKSNEPVATFNTSTTHKIGGTELYAEAGITDWSTLGGSHSPGLILESQLGDLEDTLNLIEEQAMASGMPPLEQPQQVTA